MTELPLPRRCISRTVSLEPVLFAGGGRALLMQVAHPSVAAGVAAYSDYRTDPWNRLFRTTDTMYKLGFGTPEQSRRAQRMLAARHGRVNGVDDTGREYHATDPDLVVWVWATLVDTSLVVYEKVFGRLDPVRRARFFHEQVPVAVACGAPVDAVPDGADAFEDYVASVLDNDLHVTDAARDVRDAALVMPLPAPFRQMLGPLNAAVTVSLLPTSVREAYDLDLTPAVIRRADAFFSAARVGRHLPAGLRRAPSTLQLRRTRPLRVRGVGTSGAGARVLARHAPPAT
jgi:uncharacterized protein (DUF2236 family)